MKRINLYVSIICLLAVTTVYAQAPYNKSLDSLFGWSQSIGVFNGTVLVAKGNRIIFERAVGYTDETRSKPLTMAYRFNIGSIYKEFSAVAIMQLVEAGKLKLEDKVSQYLTGLPKWADSISIKNLLEYTSGLPDLKWNTIHSDKDVWNDLVQLDRLKFMPGTNFLYTNNNISLRQFIIEKITGKPINDYIKEHLYKPALMTASTVDPMPGTNEVAKSYNDEGYADPTEIPISGIVFVTAGDLFRWSQALNNGKLISKESISILGHSYRQANGGLGKTVWENGALTLHQHDGQSRNFEALLYSDLKNDLTVILLDNNKNLKLFDINKAIVSIVNNQSYTLPKKSLEHFLDKDLGTTDVNKIIARYYQLKETSSDKIDFSNEDDLNSIGYGLLSNKRTNDAIKIFELNTKAFPRSGNAFDSLAEAYYGKGDFTNALFYYKKSLELDSGNNNAKDMIKKLEAGNR